MATKLYHHPRHAKLAFDGKLTWASALELVETLDTAVHDYHHDAVELVVTSPGGDTDALRHALNAVRQHQAAGVSFQTRVQSYAASAAAVLACAGDFRTAAPGALLLLHSVRLRASAEVVTARSARAALDETTQVDSWLLAELISGALATRSRPPREAAAEPGDQSVLEALWPVVAPRRKRVPGALDTLTCRVCDYVEAAVEAQDALALARLYGELLPLEQPLSAPLARTLRLVDWVGQAPGPVPALTETEPGLEVPEWRRLFPPDGVVPRSVLTRHALILGETGSGKTYSAILPVLAALVRADVSTVSATLVVDPKRELLPVVEALAPGRARLVEPETVALDIMAGPRWSLSEDLAAGRWLTAAHRILVRVASFVPMSAARVLLPQAQTHEANAEFFDREGCALAQCVLALVLLLLVRDTRELIDRLTLTRFAVPFGAFRARADAGESALALTAWVLRTWVRLDPNSSSWPFSDLVQAVIPARAGAADLHEEPELRSTVVEYWDAMRKIDKQFAGVLGAAVNAVVDFARPRPARTLYVGCEPGYVDSDHRLDLAGLVSPRTATGTILVIQPARDAADHLVTVALKALVFEAVLDDPERIAGGRDLPLIGYVADEFSRFVTADPVHGEQSYLDTCRSFGGCCVLATQSVANIEYALAHGANFSAATRAAMDVLWTNTASKLTFRTTDSDTVRRVEELCPQSGGLQPVVRARPPSGLPTGSCYASLADGRFERCRLAPFVGPEAERAVIRYPALAGPEPGRAPEACAVSCDEDPARTAGLAARREQGDD